MNLSENITVITSLRWHPRDVNYFSPPGTDALLGLDRVFFDRLPEEIVVGDNRAYKRGESRGRNMDAEEFRNLTGLDPETNGPIRVIITPYSQVNHS